MVDLESHTGPHGHRMGHDPGKTGSLLLRINYEWSGRARMGLNGFDSRYTLGVEHPPVLTACVSARRGRRAARSFRA